MKIINLMAEVLALVFFKVFGSAIERLPRWAVVTIMSVSYLAFLSAVYGTTRYLVS